MPPKKKAEKPQSLSEAISELRTKDKLEIGHVSDFEMVPSGLSTGNLSLDTITDVGGLPKGRITELVGPPSSGKTTSALQAAARVQQAGGNIVFLDYEHAIDENYCKALGLDITAESFIYMQPDYFEQGANAFRKLLRTGEVGMGVFDSVATMITKHELEADTGAVQVADRAKMMHQFLRQINHELSKSACAAVFLNHQMDVVDASPMGRKLSAQGIVRKTQPGGKALPFYSSLRIEFKQVGNIRSSEMDVLSNEAQDRVTQTKVQATVIKNKVGEAYRTTELRNRYGLGFSQGYSVLSILAAYKAVKKKTAGNFEFPEELRPSTGEAKVQGEDKIIKMLESDPDWLATLENKARSLLSEHGDSPELSEAIGYVDGAQYDENGELPDDVDVDGLLES